MRFVFNILLVAALVGALACGRATSHQSASPRVIVPATSATPPLSTNLPSQDFVLANDINKSLSGSGLENIKVMAVNGNITICGYVDHAVQKARAEEIAKTTPGVVNVNNYIEVGKKPPVNSNKPGGPRQHPCDF